MAAGTMSGQSRVATRPVLGYRPPSPVEQPRACAHSYNGSLSEPSDQGWAYSGSSTLTWSSPYFQVSGSSLWLMTKLGGSKGIDSTISVGMELVEGRTVIALASDSRSATIEIRDDGQILLPNNEGIISDYITTEFHDYKILITGTIYRFYVDGDLVHVGENLSSGTPYAAGVQTRGDLDPTTIKIYYVACGI